MSNLPDVPNLLDSPERISEKLEPGLPIDEVVLRLHYFNDSSDRSQRGLAFFLSDMDERAVQQACGSRRAVVFAQQHLVMEVRRARELIQVGKFLQDMTLIDVALSKRRLSWSKVLILMPTVMTHNQQQWIELAENRSCRQLRIDVARAVAGRQPRKGDGEGAGGLRKARFKVRGELELEDWDRFEGLRQKMMEKTGALVTDTMVIVEAVRVLAAQTPALQSPALETPTRESKAPQIAVAPDVAPDAAPDLSVDSSPEPEDRQTPDKLRREVLARDGCRCLNCESSERLHVHHVVYLSHGGRTEAANLLAVCDSCHSLIHEGLLFVMGAVPEQVWFADRDGQPVGRRMWVDQAVSPLFQVGQQPEAKSAVAGGERPPRGGRSPRDDDDGRPTRLSYDEIPDVVSREWWDAHEHLLVFSKNRLCIKASALKKSPGIKSRR